MRTTAAFAVRSAILAARQPPQISMSPLELDGYLTGIIVTPQTAPIRLSASIAQLWGDDAPIFEDEAQIEAVLGPVMTHYNALLRDIDSSLKRMEADRSVDYRPLFLSGDQKPAHDTVRTWVRGFWKAMALAPETWSALDGGRADQDHHCAICRLFRLWHDRAAREPR